MSARRTWTAQDEAELKSLMQRRHEGFSELREIIHAALTTFDTTPDQRVQNVLDGLLREGESVANMFRLFLDEHPPEDFVKVILRFAQWGRCEMIGRRIAPTEGLLAQFDAVLSAAERAVEDGYARLTEVSEGADTKLLRGRVIFEASGEEYEVIRGLAEKKELSNAGVLRQALRMYQAVESGTYIFKKV